MRLHGVNSIKVTTSHALFITDNHAITRKFYAASAAINLREISFKIIFKSHRLHQKERTTEIGLCVRLPLALSQTELFAFKSRDEQKKGIVDCVKHAVNGRLDIAFSCSPSKRFRFLVEFVSVCRCRSRRRLRFSFRI